MTGLTKSGSSALRRFGGDSFGELRQQMEDMFESFFSDMGFVSPASDLVPKVDVSETDEAVHVVTDLPGFKAEEVDLEINENYLTISGQHTEEQEEKGNGRKFHRVERRTGTFSRTVVLPCPVKQEDVDAELKDGVLTINLPKSDKAKRQKITVKGAAPQKQKK